MDILSYFINPKKILVVGDIVLDKYIYCDTKRISSETAIPVFTKKSEEFRLGGCGNVAKNLSHFNLDTNILDTTNEQLVSSDFNHVSASGIYDANLTKVIDKRLVKVFTWYDNEWGFSNRMADTAGFMGSL